MLNIRLKFAPPDVAEINQDTLDDAVLKIASHRASLEFHESMVAMYEKRIARLKEEKEGFRE